MYLKKCCLIAKYDIIIHLIEYMASQLIRSWLPTIYDSNFISGWSEDLKNAMKTDGRLFITLNLPNEDSSTLIKLARHESMNKSFRIHWHDWRHQSKNFKGDDSLFEWNYWEHTGIFKHLKILMCCSRRMSWKNFNLQLCSTARTPPFIQCVKSVLAK